MHVLSVQNLRNRLFGGSGPGSNHPGPRGLDRGLDRIAVVSAAHGHPGARQRALVAPLPGNPGVQGAERPPQRLRDSDGLLRDRAKLREERRIRVGLPNMGMCNISPRAVPRIQRFRGMQDDD